MAALVETLNSLRIVMIIAQKSFNCSLRSGLYNLSSIYVRYKRNKA